MMLRTALCAALLAGPCPGGEKPSLVLERIADLDFGTLVAGDAGGSLVLDPEGGPPRSASLVPGPGASAPALFHLQGPPLTAFSLHFGSAAASATRGTDRFQVDGFQPGQPLAFDGAGRAQVRVGATLRVPAGAKAGPLPAVTAMLTVRCQGLAPVSVPFSARGRLMQALSAQERSPLDFGLLLAPATDASLRLDPSGGGAGGLVTVLKEGGAGRFELTGEDGAQVLLQLPRTAALRGPGGTLELEAFRSDAAGDSLMLQGGRAEVRVGATLKVKARQAPGTYRGTYEVTFVYQ